MNFVDLHGDSLTVDEIYREDVNSYLKNVYGDDIAKDIVYTESGRLQYNGDLSKLDRKTRKLLRQFIDEVLNNVVDVSISIVSEDIYIMDKRKLSDEGGAATIKEGDKYVIYLNKNAPKKLDVKVPVHTESPGNLNMLVPVETNSTDMFFHEIAEVMYRGKRTSKVIRYNNKVRSKLKLNKRPMDTNHNYGVKNKL